METTTETKSRIFLPHLSASTVNSFINDRFSFYQSKVMRKPFAGNVFTARGKAIEHSVNQWIEGNSDTNYLQHAYDAYDAECNEAGISKLMAADHRDTIKGLLDVAMAVYRDKFSAEKPITQQKGSLKIEGIDREFVSYLDYYIPGKQIRDCKVASRTPSVLSQSYIIQGALYRKKYGVSVIFDFFVDNKKPVHKELELTNEQYSFGLSYLIAAAKVMEQLQVEEDPKEIIRLMSFPNIDNLYNLEEKKEAAAIWNIKL